jgi:hypothetical protein
VVTITTQKIMFLTTEFTVTPSPLLPLCSSGSLLSPVYWMHQNARPLILSRGERQVLGPPSRQRSKPGQMPVSSIR